MPIAVPASPGRRGATSMPSWTSPPRRSPLAYACPCGGNLGAERAGTYVRDDRGRGGARPSSPSSGLATSSARSTPLDARR
jgi:hypothetical protein